MKKTVQYLAILFLLLSFLGKLPAQCIADAGNDLVFCMSDDSVQVVSLGGNPTVTGGTSPYTYLWETEVYLGILKLTASDFLDDTTSANPGILPIYNGVGSVTFFLTITDSLGNTCSDTVNVRYSSVIIFLFDWQATIVQGDSVQLDFGPSGGIPPFTYTWTPTYKLSDSLVANPWASPDSTTFYSSTRTDSAGCQVTDPDLKEVFVIPVGIEGEVTEPNFVVFPNPSINGKSINIHNYSQVPFSLELLDGAGKKILEKFVTEFETVIESSQIQPGLYFLKLKSEKGEVGIWKLVIN